MNIKVSWNANAAAEQVQTYKIFRWTAGNPQAQIGSVAGDITSYIDVNPAPANYIYGVKASGFAGDSALSATATTPPAPTAPGGVTVTVET